MQSSLTEPRHERKEPAPARSSGNSMKAEQDSDSAIFRTDEFRRVGDVAFAFILT